MTIPTKLDMTSLGRLDERCKILRIDVEQHALREAAQAVARVSATAAAMFASTMALCVAGRFGLPSIVSSRFATARSSRFSRFFASTHFFVTASTRSVRRAVPQRQPPFAAIGEADPRASDMDEDRDR